MNETTTEVDKIVTARRLDREDYQTQIESAAQSVVRGHYATAKAKLHGAILILDQMQARVGR